jgi:hypothetical protein
MVLDHGVAGDLEQPGREALLVPQAGEPALEPDEDVLKHILDLGGWHPTGEEWPEP